MFKLESYISPLLMGYIDKYVKLHQEDFQLSLWGGDAVLNNLDLRLDVIEKAVHLPIVFKSGHIHELRIHVPWTKLGSEPVVITINTIECILKLRDSQFETSSKGSRSDLKRSKSRSALKQRKQEGDDLPPGYLQSLMNKIVNNVSIIVNNLIVKFVEDDIVLSLNIKSAELYSVDENWERDFIELSLPELVLRKSINLCDLTVCLDKCDSSGKIEHYQDPLIYRCSVTGRLYTKYDSMSAKRASVTKFDLFCEHLDVSLTDTQLPMFERLIEMCIALYYGTLDPAKKDEGLDGSVMEEEETNTTIDMEEDSASVASDMTQQQGWGQWMWSYVPQILPEGTEEGEDQENITRKKPVPPVLAIGMYGHKISIIFKLTEKLREKVHYGPQKIAFRPFILLECEGIAVDILMQGLAFFDAQVGITHLNMSCQGQCICGVKDDSDLRSKTMAIGGDSLIEKTEVNYYSNSLFDKSSAANQGQPLNLLLDSESHNQTYTEQYSLQKFGAFFFDYLYVMPEQEEKSSGPGTSASSVSDMSETLFMKENSLIRFIIGPCQLNATSSSIHRFQKLLACAYNYNYEPYYKGKPETVDDNRPHPTEDQIKCLEEFIPTKTFHVSLLQPVMCIQYADHPICDVAKKSYKTVQLQKNSKSSTSEPSPVEYLPCLHLTTARFEYQTTSVMYPRKLVKLISKMAAPSSNLLHHCHTHMQFKLFDFSTGLVTRNLNGNKSHVVTVVPPCSGALYTRKLQLTVYWKNSHMSKVEKLYELPQVSVNLNKANLLMILEIYKSWLQKVPKPTDIDSDTLLDDVFTTDESTPVLPLLEINIDGFEMKHCITSLVSAYTGTLSSVQIILYDVQVGSIIPLLCCPGNTSKLTSTEYFRNPSPLTEDKNDFLTFTLQLPHQNIVSDVPNLFLLNTEGIICAIDPALSDWFDYIPKTKFCPREHEEEPVKVDLAIAQAASPLQHLSQASSGSVARDTTSFSKTKTHSRNRSTSQKVPSQKTDSNNKGLLGDKLAAMFPLIRMLQVHVEVKSCAIFIHQSTLKLTEPSVDISQNLLSAITTNTLPPTLVVCLPQVQITSSGMKPTSCLQEIPVSTVDGSLVGEKLPWRMVLTNFCVHTILSQQSVFPIVKPTTVSCTIGVTTKYNPPTSDNISSLGLCLHTDMHAVIVSMSKLQAELCKSVVNQLIGLSSTVAFLVSSLQKKDQSQTPHSDQPDLSEIALPEPTPPDQPRDYTGMTETETSDVTSREPTPSLDLINEKSGDKVKLSLWLQWTLPKLEFRFYSENTIKDGSKFSLTLDDLTLSLDVEQVYTKAKVKCGTFNAHIYHRNTKNNQWEEQDYLGIVITCQKEIPHDTHMICNKMWSGVHQTVSNFSPRDSSSRDVTHSFLNFTFTRALCKNVAKKMRKLNDDLAEIGNIGDGTESYDLYFHKYICEICLNIEPCDIVFQPSAISTVLDCFCPSQTTVKAKSYDKQEYVLKNQLPKQSMPIINASTLPLIYINMSSVRLFLPKIGSESRLKIDVSNSQHALMDQDLAIAAIQTLSVVPQADNPLPRHPVDRELYHRALHANLTHQPGSAIENRQYQIDIKGMSLCTGTWNDFLDRVTNNGRQSNQPSVQIPALEWNTADKPFRKEKEDIELLPLVSGVDVKVVAAPAIVYQPPGVTDSFSKVLVCGHALEINFTNDLDICISTNQVKVISDIALQGIAKMTEVSVDNSVMETFDGTDLSASGSENIVADSGIESDISTITGKRTKDRKPQITLNSPDMGKRPKFIAPLDVLLTASRISVVTYSHKIPVKKLHKQPLPEAPQLSKSCSEAHTFIKLQVPEQKVKDEGHLDVTPFLYVYISQPHTVLSCHQEHQKFEMSCYDILVKGSSAKVLQSEIAVIPETTDYNVYWFETRPGKPHPKTGIPPSLFTLKVEDFLVGAASIHLRLDRPLKINFSLEKIDQVNSFLSEILPPTKTSDKPTKVEQVKKDNSSDPVLAILSKVSRLDLYTDQVVFAMETRDKHHGILTSLDWLSLETAFNQTKIGHPLDIDINMHLKNILVKTVYEKKSRSLMQPFNVTIETDVQLSSDMDQDLCQPRSVVTLTTGLVSVLIGQEHVMCFEKILNEITSVLKPKSKQTLGKQEMTTPPVVIQPNQAFARDQTSDDIRQGQFTYIMDQDGDVNKCGTGEIIFCNRDKDGNSHMTWCYHQPRVVSLVKFTPIPFNIPVKQVRQDQDDEQLVPCCLQYYDPASHNFVNFIDFELSENEDTNLMFPEINSDNAREITVSHMWRVVIYQGFLDGLDQHSPTEESTLAILPISLAAAMRVDSCYIPSLIPSIQWCISCPVIEARLQNHPQYLGQGVPGKLQPYNFDDTPLSEEEFALVTVKNLMLTGSQLIGELARINAQISSNISLSVVEMKHLTVHQMVSGTDVFMDVAYLQHLKPPALESNINVGPMSARVGQGMIHTLNSAVQSFTQMAQPNDSRVIFSQYVVCNDTYHTVRFGQIGTEENIVLKSRQMHSYSWRSHKMKKEIHMCLDGKIWKWCAAFNLDTVGTIIRVVKTIDRQYTVLIQIKQLSNSQKQIVIKGQFSFANRTSCDLEVEMHSPSLETGEVIDVLPGATISPTYVLEIDSDITINIRKRGILSWSKDVVISKHKVPSSHMVYVPVHHESYVHVWCHVYEQISRGASRLMVVFCPLYVLRSHLPCSLFVSMGIPNLGKQKELEMEGKGKELQLELLGDAKYNLSFKLRSDTEKVEPALTLTPELINQVEKTEVKRYDFDKMVASLDEPWSDRWPYTGYTTGYSENLSPRQPGGDFADLDLSLPSIDLSLTLAEYWPGCSTLLIDVCPWCLLTNHSILDLVLIDSSKTTWPLPHGKTFSPPKLQNSFTVGILINGNLYTGGDIGLSDEAVADQRYRQDLGKTLYTDGYAVTQIAVKTQLSTFQVYFLTLQSKMVSGMRIITIRETYCISNQSALDLTLSHHCVQLCQKKFSLTVSDENNRELRKKSSQTIPLPCWSGYSLNSSDVSDISFVNYVLMRQDLTSAEGNTSKADWSIPVRLVANENPGRVTVSLPVVTESVMSLPLCIVGQTKHGVSYFVIKEDKSPSCLLYNYTNVPIVYGYQNLSISRAGYTTQEEAELTDILPTILPNQNVFYTPSMTNRQFQLSIGDGGLPRIHVGIQRSSDTDESDSESKHSQDQDWNITWSDPLDINEDMERFISLPNLLNLKVKVIHASMVTHVVINAASKAEVSAKEIRNKIGTVTITENQHKADDKNLEVKEFDVGVLKQEVFINSNILKRSYELYASLHLHHWCLVLQDESSSDTQISEVIRVTCDHLFLAHYPLIEGFDENSPCHDCYSVSAENIQIDNQLFETKGLYDFPVIFARREPKKKDEDFLVEFHSMNLSEKLAVIKARSFAHVLVVMETDCLDNSLIKSVEIAMEPILGNVDDRFVYRMLEEIEKLIPSSLSGSDRCLKDINRMPSHLVTMSHGLSSPIRIKQLVIQPCSLLISIHASLKLFIASDKTPLTFGKFEKRGVNSTTHQLVRVLAMHYASSALFRAGIVVGSLEILGNPTGLIRSIGTGVADLVRLPYGGLTQGPGAFVSGVSSGMSSFVRNISSGMLTSVTNFASSVSRNMDRLSMDDSHRERQEERRRQHPMGLTSGLRNGLTGFGMSLLGAVAGIADQPLQTMMSRGEGQRSGASELVSGVGKGLVGVFTKPIGGAAEFLSQTGQGLLYGTGLSGDVIKPSYPAEEINISHMNNSHLKYIRKLLQSLPNCELQSSIVANYLDIMDSEVKVELLLTNELMLMLGIEDDSQQQAFSLAELEVKVQHDNPQLITFVWRDSFHQDIPQTSAVIKKSEKENKDRVAAFIDGTSEFVRPDISLKLNLNPTHDIPDFPQVSPPDSVESYDDSRPVSPSLSPTCRPSFAPEYHFLVDPYAKDVFLAIFSSTKLKLSGKGFLL